MDKSEKIKKGDDIKADVISRKNFSNGKYRTGKLGLDNILEIKSNNVFYLESMRMRANLADKIITDAELQGLDTSDIQVMMELGEKINAIGTPVNKSESIMSAVFVSLYLMAYYGVAIGIWGLVFKKSFLIFGLWGIAVGLLINLFSAGVVIAFQRTKEQIKDKSFAISAIWGNLAIAIGVIGLITWVARSIF